MEFAQDEPSLHVFEARCSSERYGDLPSAFRIHGVQVAPYRFCLLGDESLQASIASMPAKIADCLR
jgi:hypothetical protein